MTNQEKLLQEYNANHPSKLDGCLSALLQLAIGIICIWYVIYQFTKTPTCSDLESKRISDLTTIEKKQIDSCEGVR